LKSSGSLINKSATSEKKLFPTALNQITIPTLSFTKDFKLSPWNEEGF
jgi:hypothetical protein